jgi:hypothetical protein
MTKLLRNGRGWFGVVMLSVLAFGARSAFAKPTEAVMSRGDCRPRACNDGCKAAGAQYGICNYMDQSCDCVY